MRRNDAMGAVAELAASQHGAFSRRQAAANGFTRRQIQALVAASIVDEPVSGVLRICGSPPSWRQEMMVATLVGPGFHAGFRAAAYLHDIDGFRRPPPIEVVGGPSCRRIHGLDVIQHWVEPLAPEDLVVIDGIPCTGLARSVVDVCGLGDADLALRSVDDFERRRASLNWLRLTTERLHRPGQSGTRVCRDLLDRRQRGGRVPDSWFERLVDRCVSRIDLPPWFQQHVVRDDGGTVVGRLDLACPALWLGVEAHSRQFHFGDGPETLDEQRDNRLGALGWHLVYVGWYATEAPATVAATIDAIARRRAAQLGVALPWAA
jgi:hypothetical protein